MKKNKKIISVFVSVFMAFILVFQVPIFISAEAAANYSTKFCDMTITQSSNYYHAEVGANLKDSAGNTYYGNNVFKLDYSRWDHPFENEAYVTYYLGRKCSSLTLTLAVNKNEGTSESILNIFGDSDDDLIYSTGLQGQDFKPVNLKLNVKGRTWITLKVDNNGNRIGHQEWLIANPTVNGKPITPPEKSPEEKYPGYIKFSDLVITESSNYTHLDASSGVKDTAGNTYYSDNIFTLDTGRWDFPFENEAFATYYLGGRCKYLTLTLAVYLKGGTSESTLSIFGDSDASPVYSSGICGRQFEPVQLKINVSGLDWITFRIHNESRIGHIEWLIANPMVDKNPIVPPDKSPEEKHPGYVKLSDLTITESSHYINKDASAGIKDTAGNTYYGNNIFTLDTGRWDFPFENEAFVTYYLGGRCKRLTFTLAVYINGGTSKSTLDIFGDSDSSPVYSSGICGRQFEPTTLTLDVSGFDWITFRVHNESRIGHIEWLIANPMVDKNPIVPPAKTSEDLSEYIKLCNLQPAESEDYRNINGDTVKDTTGNNYSGDNVFILDYYRDDVSFTNRSYAKYYLGKKYGKLTLTLGVNFSGGYSQSRFNILGNDTVPLYDSGINNRKFKQEHITIDVSGMDWITFKISDNSNRGHIEWIIAEPRLYGRDATSNEIVNNLSEGLNVFSNSSSHSYYVGEKIILPVTKVKDGSLSLPGKLAVSVSDSNIVSFESVVSIKEIAKQEFVELNLSDLIKNSDLIKLKAKKEGKVCIRITDTTNGESVTVPVSVTRDEHESYRADKIKARDFVATGFNYEVARDSYYLDCNGLWVADFKYSEKGQNYNFKMNIYNEKYNHGVVEVYNQEGKLIEVQKIEKFTTTGTGIKDIIISGWNLIKDIPDGSLLTFRSSATAECTPIDIDVPKNGYIRITNNSGISVPCWILNSFDLILSSGKFISSLDSVSPKQIDFFEKNLLKKFIINEYNLKVAEKYQDKMKKDISENFSENALLDIITNTSCGMKNFLNELNIDFKTLIKDYSDISISVAEGLFEKLSGPAGVALKIIFTSSEASNVIRELRDFVLTAKNDKCIIIYTPTDPSFRQNMKTAEIRIDNTKNLPENVILEGYKILKDEEIVIDLKTGEILNDSRFYNIAVYSDDGKEIQPSGKVKVYIKIPEGFGEHVQVVKQTENGWRFIDSTVKDGTVCFETDHFCVFALMDILRNDDYEYLFGDIDNDGKITASDARFALRASVGLETKTAELIKIADMDKDGRITAADARIILRKSVGLDK